MAKASAGRHKLATGRINDVAPIVMQFTGLKDRAGKDVFEGDIVRVYDMNRCCICHEWEDCDGPGDGGCEVHGEHNHEQACDCEDYVCTQEVRWKSEGGYWCDKDTGEFCPALGSDELYLEVIGNVHENPELLI